MIYTHERELMPRLLETMSASGRGLRMRLILVDNASTDGVEPWRDCFPETRVLHNARRLSYAANLNRILDAATAPYVLLMNTDMYFDPREQCLRRMVAFMDGQPRVRHRRLPAVSCRRFGGPRRPAVPDVAAGAGAALRAGPMAAHAPWTAISTPNMRPHETWPCDWLSGCFLMVRREAIEEVGRFDEVYGKYFEDVDICLRMARAGWQVMYHGAASCCPSGAACQQEPVLGRRLDAPSRLPSLAPQMGFPARRLRAGHRRSWRQIVNLPRFWQVGNAAPRPHGVSTVGLTPNTAEDRTEVMALITLRVLDGADRGRVFADTPTPLDHRPRGRQPHPTERRAHQPLPPEDSGGSETRSC